nr:uncharacterized protein LOC120972677 [Aegilops tauschii subsp. strangulata]
MWKLLFKSHKSWPETTEDLGYDCTHAATPAAMQASAAHAAKASELRRKLEEKQADTSEVETLKSTLAEAKKGAEEERAARLKYEARVGEVQQELKDAINNSESLERKILDQNSELAKSLQSAQEARIEAQSAVREIQEAKQIAAGARMAFARVKVKWAKMDAVKLATEGLPVGKEHRMPERYFNDVLKGSRIVEGQYSKAIIFE